MLEDEALQALQRPARLEPQLLAEQLARLAVHGERLALSVCPVEGEHQLPAETLLEWTGPDQRFQLGHELGAATERQVGVDPVHHHREAKLFDPPDLALDELQQREVGQCRAPEEGQRLPELGRRRDGVAPTERLASLGGESFEHRDVDLSSRGLHGVATRSRDEDLAVRALV